MSTSPPDGKTPGRLSQDASLDDATPAGLRGSRDEDAGDRQAVLAHELPDEWVAKLEKPIPPYETELDDLVDEAGAGEKPGDEARERAKRAAEAMDELSRGLTLSGLSLRELIGRDRP